MPQSIASIHKMFRDGSSTPSDLLGEYLDRSEKDQLNAYITLNKENSLRAAEALDKELSASKSVLKQKPLFGIPIGLKDAIVTKGVRTTCGSEILENYIPPYSATVVERLERNGAIIIGKLNMDEFAMGSSNENSHFGAVEHPTVSGFVPGGSSGGSACAVKANLATLSLGSDTGGSIRLPASFCGVYGLKPTYGRVSRFGLVAYASSLDQIGPFANSVADLARAYECIGGYDPRDSTSVRLKVDAWKPAGVSGMKIGIPREYLPKEVDTEVEKSFSEAMQKLKDQGAEVVDISLPHTHLSVATYYIVAVSEAASNLSRYDGIRFGKSVDAGSLEELYLKVRSHFGDEVKRRILLGTFSLSSGYHDAYYEKACRVRRLVQNDFTEAFKTVDAIASPVSPSLPFKMGEKMQDPLQMYLSDLLTIPANLAGIPAASVPFGESSSGLPIGLQLMAPAFGEQRLFDVASALEGRSE